jgi:hypothetical protein
MLYASLCLYAQPAPETGEEPDYQPADSTAIKSVAEEHQIAIKAAFEHLLKGDSFVQDIIDWDDFYLNDEDITTAYYDAVDSGTELDFIAQIIAEIRDNLQTGDLAKDPYAEWSFEDNGYEIYVFCHNSVKDVDMWFSPPSDTYPMHLVEISTTYR